MTLEEIVAEIQFKYPQLKRAFGTINNFIENLSITYPRQAAQYLVELLNFKGKLVIIDPIYQRFTLYDNYEEIDQEAVIFEEPYNVYSFDRDLLYSVSSHFGIFGNSILDGLLNIDFRSASLFYLDYQTYQGKKQIILVNGLLPTQVTKPIRLQEYKSSTLIKGNTFNQVSLKLTNGSRDMTKPGLPYYPINVYYLSTSSPVVLSRQSIINSSLSQKTTYDLENSNQFLITPGSSGWLVFTQSTTPNETPLILSNKNGTGIDRLIEAATGVYYIAIDEDINMNLLKQAFDLDSISLPNFDNYQGLDIKADLSVS
jgi:hypothetical protein